jgi:hypothetical protein
MKSVNTLLLSVAVAATTGCAGLSIYDNPELAGKPTA